MYNFPPLAVVGAHIETVICHLSSEATFTEAITRSYQPITCLYSPIMACYRGSRVKFVFSIPVCVIWNLIASCGCRCGPRQR